MLKAVSFLSLLVGIFSPLKPMPYPATDTTVVFSDFEKLSSIKNPTIANARELFDHEDVRLFASYDTEKAASKKLRAELNTAINLKQTAMADVKAAFSDHFVNRLIPHWYGTEWSFSGHTAVPNSGQIACGYFVSTTLRDMGLRLNRYKLAQKSPIDEAKMISCGAVVNTITATNSATALEEINKITQEGISFIGFDEGHVGFLLKKQGELFLIHSNYLYPNAEVIMERIEESNVFKKFTTFHLVDISNNDLLIERWLNDGQIL
jgi:hypothetical protein